MQEKPGIISKRNHHSVPKREEKKETWITLEAGHGRYRELSKGKKLRETRGRKDRAIPPKNESTDSGDWRMRSLKKGRKTVGAKGRGMGGAKNRISSPNNNQ